MDFLDAKQHAFSKITFQQILENSLLFNFVSLCLRFEDNLSEKKKTILCQKCSVVTDMATTSHCLSSSSEQFLN